LADLLDGPLAGAFGGVHVLPFFTPHDGVDAGFDPRDHTVVDPRLGTWDDVRHLAQGRTVMADVIVNHMSTQSEQFLDVRERGDASPWAPMFLTLSSVFPQGASETDLARIYRPRPTSACSLVPTTRSCSNARAWVGTSTATHPRSADVDRRRGER